MRGPAAILFAVLGVVGFPRACPAATEGVGTFSPELLAMGSRPTKQVSQAPSKEAQGVAGKKYGKLVTPKGRADRHYRHISNQVRFLDKEGRPAKELNRASGGTDGIIRLYVPPCDECVVMRTRSTTGEDIRERFVVYLDSSGAEVWRIRIGCIPIPSLDASVEVADDCSVVVVADGSREKGYGCNRDYRERKGMGGVRAVDRTGKLLYEADDGYNPRLSRNGRYLIYRTNAGERFDDDDVGDWYRVDLRDGSIIAIPVEYEGARIFPLGVNMAGYVDYLNMSKFYDPKRGFFEDPELLRATIEGTTEW